MRACGGVWIAHGGGSADRETCDANDRLQVPPDDPTYTLRRVWLTDEEQDGYYYGLANEGLWPLCHIAFVRPAFREQDWALYKEVNAALRRRRRRGGELRKSRGAGAGLSFRAAAAHDPPAPAQGDHHHLLAHSLAQCRNLRRSAPGATKSSTACSARRSSVSTPASIAIISSTTVDRFIESRIDRENSSITRRGAGNPDPALSHFDRMAAARAGRPGAGGGVPRRRAPAFRPSRGHPHRRRRRALRLYQGHSRPHARHRRSARRQAANGAARSR